MLTVGPGSIKTFPDKYLSSGKERRKKGIKKNQKAPPENKPYLRIVRIQVKQQPNVCC